MAKFGIVDLGSKFIKYTIVDSGQCLDFNEVEINQLENDLADINHFFDSRGLNTAHIFLSDKYFLEKELDLQQGKGNEGLLVEMENVIQNLSGSYFYSKFNKSKPSLKLYSLNSKIIEFDKLKKAFSNTQISLYPDQIALLNLIPKNYQLLDIGHFTSVLFSIQKKAIAQKAVVQYGFDDLLNYIQEYSNVSRTPAFEMALDYLKHPKTLNSKQLEICQQACRKFSREFMEKIMLHPDQTLILTGGGSFIPELLTKLYALPGDFKIHHLSDLLDSQFSIYNNIYSFKKFLDASSNSPSYNIDAQLQKTLKVYSLTY